jgi:hypothetical protein
MQRRTLIACTWAPWAGAALAHHGWSSFDQTRPLYLEGRADRVAWRNPHAEFDLEPLAQPRLPADLATRPVPPQVAGVDGAALLKAARLPTRMEAWGVPPLRDGDAVAVLGFTFAGERGDALLRAEYLFLGGRTYGLRSAPA